MKNFRKVLALVLVMATLFSFASMASAKKLADYTDVASISYDEAVAVLSGIEILEGDPDGSFRPTDSIKRSEMAKMIAIMANAGYEIDKLYADACDFADCTDSWAKSYIAYCASTGIVAGYSKNVFNPNGNVTALETAKMLLVMIGFDAEAQGYINNANWKVNVLRDAKVMGLTNGFPAGYDMDKNITREEAAQMMLNALEAPAVVGYLSGKIINVTNALVYDQVTMTANGNYAVVVNYATLKDALKVGNWALYGNVVISDDLLGWTLFGLQKNETTAADCYGRPGTSWSWTTAKHGVITVGSFDDTLVKEFTTAADVKTLLATEAAAGVYSITGYVDGKQYLYDAAYTKGADETAVQTWVTGVTGNGVETEVYVDDVEKEITIVVINTYFGKVWAAPKASNTFNVYTIDAEAKSVDLCFSNKGYNFAEGDLILFWLCEGGKTLHNAQKAAVDTTGAVTRTETTPIAIVGGKTFSYAKYETNFMTDAEVRASTNAGKVYAVYTDLFGYVKYWKDATATPATNYAYFVEGTGKWDDNGRTGSQYFTYTASYDLVDFTAALKDDQPVNDATFTALEANDAGEKNTRGILAAYKVDAAGRAYLDTTKGANKDGKATVFAGSTLAKNGNLTAADGTVYYGTEASKYLVRTWDYAAKAYVYTAYTENTLPSAFASYKLVDANKDGVLDLQNTLQAFVGVKNGVNVVDYLFIDAAFATTDVDAYIVKYVKSVSDTYFVNQINAFDMYSAYIGGEAGYILITKDQQTITNNWLYKANLVCIGLYDDNLPIYAAVTKLNAENSTDYVTFDATANEIFFAGKAYDYAEGFYAVVYNQDTKAVTVLKTPADLNNYVETIHAQNHSANAACTCQAFKNVQVWKTESPAGTLKCVYININEQPDAKD